MTQKFVRYGPEVEQEEPDFDQTLQAVLEGMRQRMRGHGTNSSPPALK